MAAHEDTRYEGLAYTDWKTIDQFTAMIGETVLMAYQDEPAKGKRVFFPKIAFVTFISREHVEYNPTDNRLVKNARIQLFGNEKFAHVAFPELEPGF
jgi:hypothetical protein